MILDLIKAYGPGTAGSSLKICTVAFNVIDFLQEYDISGREDISNMVKEYMSTLSNEDKQRMRETIEEIESDVAHTLFTKGFETLMARLDEAGNPNKRTVYNKGKYGTFIATLKSDMGI